MVAIDIKNKLTNLERFESKVTWNGSRMPHMTTSCYGWLDIPNKYSTRAQFNLNGNMNASRAAWMLYVGEIPDGLWVLHYCDNKLCTRVEHLYLDTPKQNSRDTVNRGRPNNNNQNKDKTKCIKGHIFDKTNTYINKNRRHCRECQKTRNNTYILKKQQETGR